MKLLATKENLLFGVSAVQKAVSSKNVKPILTCIKIDAHNGLLYFYATDLEIGIQCYVPVEIIEEGSTVIPAKYLLEIVRKLPDSQITLETTTNNELEIKYEQSQLNLKSYYSNEFPNFSKTDNNYELSISTSLFKQMIKQVVFACGTDDNKPFFMGVLCEVENNNLKMISTDTHRLALKQCEIQNISEEAISFIVPSKILSELARLMQDENEICNIKISKNVATFTVANILLVCRLLDGQFPNYTQVIPTEYTLKIKAKTKILNKSVERISLFTENDNSSNIKISVQNNNMIISSQSELGNGYEKIDIDVEGEPVDIFFNYNYLLDVFKVIEDEYLTIEFTGPLSPGIVRSYENNNFIYLILPVRS
ncbi:MAG: DNA polymerase III subunit beta [Clostridia bacterium]|nr:DNA polymerase III subunit beta [Clostridia bacterium]MDD4047752.1 DNA polymerase III subunit beta [Clostridia bacterium]